MSNNKQSLSLNVYVMVASPSAVLIPVSDLECGPKNINNSSDL